MLCKKIFLLNTLLFSFVYADKFDVIKELENRAFSQEINLKPIEKQIQEQNFENGISKIYSETLKNIDIETRRIQGEDIFLENMKIDKKLLPQQEFDVKKFLLTNRIYIFMSESVPMEIWHTYGKLMHDKKLSNTTMVLRGCIGGNCTKIAPTSTFILKLKQYDKNKEINPNVIIDPLLFRKYKITQAPCVVFAQNTQTKDFSQSEGNDENFNAKNIYKSCGVWNLQWHLKQIQQKANSKELEEIISYLEPKGGV